MLKQAALTGAVALLLSSIARAQGAPTDAQIFSDIVREVVTYPRFTVFDNINGSVDHGVVTLTGEVTQPFKAADIARRVERVRGVVTVRNEIQTLPVSFFDDESAVPDRAGHLRQPGLLAVRRDAEPADPHHRRQRARHADRRRQQQRRAGARGQPGQLVRRLLGRQPT